MDIMSLRQRRSGPTKLNLSSNESHGNEFMLNPAVWSPLALRKHPALKYLILMVVLIVSIFVFGTVYSNVTSRDACQVLQEFTRDKPPTNLPRLFHFQSKTRNLTKETKTWMDVLSMPSKIQEYPNIVSDSSSWTAVYWSDESCKQLVEDHFSPFLPTFNSFPHNIQRVDSCRYLILYTYGGVYADTDISIHVSTVSEFERLIPDGVGLVESPYRYNEIWQNSLMTSSVARHVFWNVTLDIIMERQGESVVLSSTGPKMISDAVEQFRNRYGNGSNMTPDVYTLPCELFQRLPSGEWGTTWLNILGREVLARAIPMQGCGRYGDGRCEIIRHTGRASWTKDAGIA